MPKPFLLMKPYLKLLSLALFCHIFGIAALVFAGAQLLDRHFTIFEDHFGPVLRYVAQLDNTKETRNESG